MKKPYTVLIFQGGGALGVYQAGVFEALQHHAVEVDWVIGTSIGAINGALIAGNPPESRLEQLHGFWKSLTPEATGSWLPWTLFMPWLTNWVDSVSTLSTLTHGVEGFFRLRPHALWDAHTTVPVTETSFYDTRPLKATLEKFIDFDYLNRSPMRLCVSAVDIESGEIVLFDTARQSLGPEHIMASGALPPGFPPIEISGRYYWDGGIYSNTPLDIFLEDEDQRDALCFMVDLWDPIKGGPTSISQAMIRYKSIQYASRTKEQLRSYQKIQELRRAIRVLEQHLPMSKREKPTVQPLLEMGRDRTINMVHLIMNTESGEDYFQDIDFSALTIETRWQSGYFDAVRSLEQKTWFKPLPAHAGLFQKNGRFVQSSAMHSIKKPEPGTSTAKEDPAKEDKEET